MEFEWLTPAQVAEKWGINARQVQLLCSQGKIEGVRRLNRSWLIPPDAKRPLDGRTLVAKQLKNEIETDKK